MNKPILVITGLVLAAAVHAASKPVTVALSDAKGASVGTATIAEGKGGKGVTIKANLKSLPPGEHAFHFHAVAKCEGPAFTSAMGHFNPEMKHHGINNPMSPKPHAGDMANFMVKPNGTAKFTIVNSDVNLGTDPHSLFSNGGTALMIHAQADDLKSDPAGNAGDRIACGVITK
jgi:Cu-Zn family superoxide dismutase